MLRKSLKTLDFTFFRYRIERVLSCENITENEIEEACSYIQKAGYVTVAGSIPEKTAYRQASDNGRAVSEVRFPTLKQRAEQVAQGIIDLLSEYEE
ncbi:hypothetical protein [Calothrix sp. 336/3]|uniref:hypothetical protein n=1 Tax=Calothrix sp. 336/3 TaxID=1337936 RepID=UPI0004E2FEDC|nr:hypothetical protein [Calothrix sp. 336/3]